MEHELITHIMSVAVPLLTLGIIIVSLRLLVDKKEADDVKKQSHGICEDFCPIYKKASNNECCIHKDTTKCIIEKTKKERREDAFRNVMRNT